MLLQERLLLLFTILILLSWCYVDLVHGLAAKAQKNKKILASGAGKGFGASTAPTFSHTPDTSPSIQTLTQFLTAQKALGVQQGVVEVGVDNETGRRGLFAVTNIKKGQVVCMIPSDVALALSDPAKMGDDAPTMAHGGLNYLKMYANNPQAREMWKPYLDTLPTRDSPQFDPTPDFFSDEEIELLEFPRLINLIRQRKTDLETVSKENRMDFDELQFATWLVSSRAFNINLSDDGEQPDEETQYDERGQVIAKAGSGLKSIRVMVPFLDLVNCDCTSPNCRFSMIDPKKDEAFFALEANRPIPAGNEIKINYRSGVYSSVELLLNYGFVPEDNNVDSWLLTKKDGDDMIANLDDWTTTLEEDRRMIKMMEGEPDGPLKKILAFRTKMKEAYKTN